jgi:hypothetical protein
MFLLKNMSFTTGNALLDKLLMCSVELGIIETIGAGVVKSSGTAAVRTGDDGVVIFKTGAVGTCDIVAGITGPGVVKSSGSEAVMTGAGAGVIGFGVVGNSGNKSFGITGSTVNIGI